MTIGNRKFAYLVVCAMCSMNWFCTKSDHTGGDKLPDVTGNQKSLNLTLIQDLNQGSIIVNSHKDKLDRSALMMDFRSYVEIAQNETLVSAPVYPRVKKMTNGKYILFYQNNQIGADIYSITSADLKSWSGGERLFARHAIIDQANNTNERRFSTCNGLVLANGDILAVASYRANSNYRMLPRDNGLILRRSTDNGQTWSTAQEIYQGTNWEPHLLQLSNGDIHCYFTDSRTHIADYNTGTALIVSKDNGQTWTPSFGSLPLRVIRQKFGEQAGVALHTDQMPAVIQLNNSNTLAAAVESYNNTSNYFLSLAYSNSDGTWKSLAENEEGPTDRSNYIFSGAAPSLFQFPSGETVLSSNSSGLFQLRMGNSLARNFGIPYTPFKKTGYWGTIEKVNSHQLIGSMHTAGAIMLARFNLNHSIQTSAKSIVVDGDNSDWSTSDEALFVGQKSQAQATLRVASDSENLYFLIEVFDNNISKDDYVSVFLTPSNDRNEVGVVSRRIRVSHSTIKSTDNYGGGWRAITMNMNMKGFFDGTLSDSSDEDKGYLVEFSIPRSELNLNNGKLLLNFALFDTLGGEDAITNTADKNTDKWIPINLVN